MTFIIKKFSLADQDIVLSKQNAPTISRYASVEKRHSTGGHHWLIDVERNCAFLRLYPKDIRGEESIYLLVLDDELVIAAVPEGSSPIAIIKHVGKGLRNRHDEVFGLLREALIVGGRYCLGSDEHSRVDVLGFAFESEEN